VLAPWPTVEVRLGQAPAVPDGFTLCVGLRDTQPPSRARFRYPGHELGGNRLDSLLRPAPGGRPMANGVVSLPATAGTWRLHAYVAPARGNGRTLRTVTPAEVVVGVGSMVIDLHVSAEEVAAAVAELQKKPAAGK